MRDLVYIYPGMVRELPRLSLRPKPLSDMRIMGFTGVGSRIRHRAGSKRDSGAGWLVPEKAFSPSPVLLLNALELAGLKPGCGGIWAQARPERCCAGGSGQRSRPLEHRPEPAAAVWRRMSTLPDRCSSVCDRRGAKQATQRRLLSFTAGAYGGLLRIAASDDRLDLSLNQLHYFEQSLSALTAGVPAWVAAST